MIIKQQLLVINRGRAWHKRSGRLLYSFLDFWPILTIKNDCTR
jgi:hypothetical protein